MSDYQVPRQVTTRLELMPGMGVAETIAVGAGLAVGYGLSRLAGLFQANAPTAMMLFFLPPVVAYVLFKGGEQSPLALLKRFRWFQSRPQRLLYRAGGGQQPTDVPRVQDWLPVREVGGGVLVRLDGSMVAGVQITALNLALKSPAEQQRIILRVHEAVNALQQPAQMLSVPRPLDLDNYVANLTARLGELDPGRRRLLQPYIAHVTGLVTAGEAQDRSYYILLPQPGGRAARATVLQQAHDLAGRLRHADLTVSVLDDAAWLDLLHVWCQPVHAAFERTPDGPPPITTVLGV